MPVPIQPTDSQLKWLTRHFRHTANDDILRRFGWSLSTLHRIARSLGLTKSRQYMRKTQARAATAARAANKARGWPPKGYRIPGADANRFRPGESNRDRLGERRFRRSIARAAATRRATIAAERRRILFGLPQRTRLKLGFSRAKVSYRYALRQRGYLIPRGGSDATVTPDTRRSPLVERRAASHGIHIIIPQ